MQQSFLGVWSNKMMIIRHTVHKNINCIFHSANFSVEDLRAWSKQTVRGSHKQKWRQTASIAMCPEGTESWKAVSIAMCLEGMESWKWAVCKKSSQMKSSYISSQRPTCNQNFVRYISLIQHRGHFISEDCAGLSWATEGVDQKQHLPSWWRYATWNV